MAVWIVGVLGLVVLALSLWRLRDRRADRAEMARLVALQPRDPPRFTPDMVAGLPAPARRFFLFAIAPGTPLYTVARIEMRGEFSLGSRAAPNYQPMRATQVLGAPHGFVWAARAGAGLMRMSGSDSGGWTRFWLDGLAPVARFGGTPDHERSAFGRYIAEALFWTPAALLPGPGVAWDAVDADTARVTVAHGTLSQSVDLQLRADGSPAQVRFERWSNANPDKTYRLQPFGGDLSQFRDFHGFRVPCHVEAGNFFGTDDYFPFFIADVRDVTFPDPPAP